MRKSYTTTEQDLTYLKKQSFNGRLEWIRKKANERNDSIYTNAKVAQDINVGPSLLGKVEAGLSKNPNLELLQKLSKYFGVPIAVFFDVYYEDLTPFTIFGSPIQEKVHPGPLFEAAYQVDFSCKISSTNSDYVEFIEDTFHLSPLEIEEFQEEMDYLLKKIKNRRKRWASKLKALGDVSKKEEEKQ